MALFKKKNEEKVEKKDTVVKLEKNIEKTEKPEKKEKVSADIATVAQTAGGQKSGKGLDLAYVLLLCPHVTEKASDLSEKGVYAFEINKRANKMHVMMAVERLYKVRPIKVAVINEPTKYSKSPKTNRVVVKKAGGKKAMVYLKKGDKIEFV